jgi:hypothetical protein
MLNILIHGGIVNQRTLRFHLTTVRMAITVGKKQQILQRYGGKGALFTVVGNINLCNCCGNQFGGSSRIFLKKLLLFDLAILHLGICLKECKSTYIRGVFIPTFNDLFPIAKLWNQLCT